MYKNIKIYIAGPECFYTNGYKRLNAMRQLAEYYGFSVTLPNDAKLDLQSQDLRKNADEIFRNCADSMNQSNVIIVDLELFRGSEPDGGSVYEIGMAYAHGCRCYAYTRDKRNMVFKHQNSVLRNELIYDAEGRILANQDLPFSPMIVGSCKIVEGGFEDCLKLLILDLEDESKNKAKRVIPSAEKTYGITFIHGDKPRVYLAGPERFDHNVREINFKMKEISARYGIEAVCPDDDCPGVNIINTDDPYAHAFNIFDRNQQHVRNCDAIIANLNDFHGFEPNSDTSFECGLAFQLGHKMYGYMDRTVPMRDHVPNYGEDKEFKDIYGYDIENFNYPINLMFSSSMKILEGKFEEVIGKIALDLGKYRT
jgi:nucleoside 2-deoxyribosyltransferase